MIEDALADTRVVLVVGARQCGKTTLVKTIARHRRAEWRNLDSSAVRNAAQADPDGFVGLDRFMVIDEVQRVPDLLLAIKEQVDTDPRPGRFLLTGSARVLGMRALPDTLPGRTEIVELWPFSQDEIDGSPDGFVDDRRFVADAATCGRLCNELVIMARRVTVGRMCRNIRTLHNFEPPATDSLRTTAPRTASRSTSCERIDVVGWSASRSGRRRRWARLISQVCAISKTGSALTSSPGSCCTPVARLCRSGSGCGPCR